MDAVALILDLTPEKCQEVLALADNALRLGLSTPDEAVAHYIKGQVYSCQKRLSEAEEEIKGALELDEKLATPLMCITAWTRLAAICEERGEVAGAIEYIQEGIKHLQTLFDPANTGRLVASACFKLALLYINHDEVSLAPHQAFLYLQKAIEADPDFPDTHLFLGAFYNDNNAPHKAIDHYERYLALTTSVGLSDNAEIAQRRELAQQKLILLKGEPESSEEILGVFPIVIKKGWTPDAYDLVFTTNRLIVAKRNRRSSRRPEYIASHASAHERVKMKKVSVERVHTYLAADERNFEVAYSDITLVEVKPHGRYRAIDFDVYMGDSDVPKHKFSIVIKQQYYDDFIQFIQKVLPSKV